EAEAAAKAALALANKQTPASTVSTQGVPSTILTPIAVTKSTIKDTIVKDGVYKVTDICSGSFAAACTKAGLS
ncbi:MAG TPA: D-xylose-binding protein, partial [Pedococcus sp.]|nr:D-xylose-binding protein [Pedococcus sp.]